MIKNVSKTEVEKLDDRNLQKAIIGLTDELVFVHGYSSEDAAIFVRSCYLYISELKKRNPKEPIKIARSEKSGKRLLNDISQGIVLFQLLTFVNDGKTQSK